MRGSVHFHYALAEQILLAGASTTEPDASATSPTVPQTSTTDRDDRSEETSPQ